MRFFILKSKYIIAAVSAAVITVSISLGVVKAIKIAAPEATYIVVIDAGHGGVDGGVVGVVSGEYESELNLKTALTLAKYFEKAGVKVVLTRKTKEGLYDNVNDNFKRQDFSRRKEIISGAQPDAVISIHMNYYKGGSRRGAQVFFNPTNGYSRALALGVQNRLNENINKPRTNREYAALSGDYYIINCTKHPSVIVECGFLSNPEDDRLLNTESYRAEIAYHIFSGCMEFLFTA